jgi:hypothetical protein
LKSIVIFGALRFFSQHQRASIQGNDTLDNHCISKIGTGSPYCEVQASFFLIASCPDQIESLASESIIDCCSLSFSINCCIHAIDSGIV